MTSIAIVTPWHDHHDLADDYMKALRHGLRDGDRCLIIDNGSSPRLWDTIHQRDDKPANVLDLRFETNLGFAKASNYGLKIAAEIFAKVADPPGAVLFLNNDVAAEQDGWLDTIRDALEPGVLVGSRIRYDRHGDIDGHKLPYLDGWCLAGMVDDLLDLEGFDEGYEEPAYFSDNDLCLRARAAGMTLREVRVGLRHKTGQTAEPGPSKVRVTNANHRRFGRRARGILDIDQTPLRFAFADHQAKARYLVGALLASGHQPTTPDQADVLLIDCDFPHAAGRHQLIEATYRNGGEVLVYPHGAHPISFPDDYQADPRVAGYLAHGPGAAAAYRQLGVTAPVHTIGWSYSPWVPFQPPAEVRRVLFAPHHPFGSGFLPDAYKKLNRAVFASLETSGLDVTVQIVGDPDSNGLGGLSHDRVRYVQSSMVLDWRAIDDADLVIGNGTLGALAAARGKPVVMFQATPTDDTGEPCQRWSELAAAQRYPIDFADAPLADLIERACADPAAVWAWRQDFLGGPFDQDGFTALAESLITDDHLAALLTAA